MFKVELDTHSLDDLAINPVGDGINPVLSWCLPSQPAALCKAGLAGRAVTAFPGQKGLV